MSKENLDDKIIQPNSSIIENSDFKSTEGLVENINRKKTPLDSFLKNISYSELMEMYISSKGDNSKLQDYLKNMKKGGKLSQEEEEFWNYAIDAELTERIFKGIIVEVHDSEENVPLDVRLARTLLKTEVELINEDTNSMIGGNNSIDTSFVKELFWTTVSTAKEIITQRLLGNKHSTQEILNSREAEILARAKEMEEKTDKAIQGVLDKMNSFNDNSSLETSPPLIQFFGTLSENITKYNDSMISKYEKDYLDKKSQGNTESLDTKYPLSTKMPTIDPVNFRRIMMGSLGNPNIGEEVENLDKAKSSIGNTAIARPINSIEEVFPE